MVKVSKWTEKDLGILTKYWHQVSNKEIGLMIGKSGGAVRLKAEKYITFDMMYGKRWSEYEDKLLLELYGTMPIEELSERMKRSKKSMQERLQLLIGSKNVNIVQDIYGSQDVALFLGVTRMTVIRMHSRGEIPMYKLGAKKLLIDAEKFWEWLENNLEVPNYLKIEDSTQLISPEWYQQIIKKKKRENKGDKSYTKWTSKEDALLWTELMKGTKYKDIALKLDRSARSVGDRVLRLTKKKMSGVS